MNIQILQATEADIPTIVAILTQAVVWMDSMGLHQWKHEYVTWEGLSQLFVAADFYIAYVGGTPGACMALIDHDPEIWPNMLPGASLYLHKVAVVRAFAGQGLSAALIDFAKAQARDRGIDSLRIDCHADRPKVRALYEGQGFRFVEEKLLFGHYRTVLYVCPV